MQQSNCINCETLITTQVLVWSKTLLPIKNKLKPCQLLSKPSPNPYHLKAMMPCPHSKRRHHDSSQRLIPPRPRLNNPRRSASKEAQQVSKTIFSTMEKAWMPRTYCPRTSFQHTSERSTLQVSGSPSRRTPFLWRVW